MDSTSLGDIVTDPVELLKLILKDNAKPDFIFRRKRGKLSLFVEGEESSVVGETVLDSIKRSRISVERR